MDYTMWKSILLDWANSTGYLVKNYENLININIEAFFREFVKQIKSEKPKSANIIDFVKDYYPEFHLKEVHSDNNNGETQLSEDEYVYVYSMLLHYSCVRYPDAEMQNVCSGLLEKYQIVVAKYFDFMCKAVKHTRECIQDAIEEAIEACDASGSFVSPLNRSFSVFSNKEVPRTPRTSKLLDSWNNDNRNLKAQLETERFERGYLEMQVKHNEEKLAKYDVDHKKAMAEINDLKKHITALMEEIATPNKSNVDPMVKRLRKNLDEKEDELAKYIQNVSELADSNALLSDKIQYAEKQIQMLTVKTFDLQDDMEKLSAQLVDRENVIKFMEETNKQQQELIKELRRPARSEDGRSEESRFNESSYEVLDSTSTSNNTSFVYPSEENLAQAVVDVRLLDQQRQNAALIETVDRLTNELGKVRQVINDLYSELSQQEALSDGADVLSEVRRLLHETLRKNNENVSRLATQRAEMKDLIKLNEQHESEAKAMAIQLKNTDEKLSRERITYDEQMATLLSKIQQTEELLAASKAEHDKLNTVNAERSAELKKVRQSLESSIGDRDVLQSKLTQLESELKKTSERLQTKSAKVRAQIEAKDSLQFQLHEVNAKMTETEDALQIITDGVDRLSREKAELVVRLKEAEQLIVALNGEIMEAQRVATNHQQALAEKQTKLDHSEKSIAQLTEEKCQLENDNLSLAQARAKAQERINELDDLVMSQSNQLEKQRVESVQKLEYCAQESTDLKLKLNAAETELIATGQTMKAKSEEVSQLKQEIATMAEKHSSEREDQQSKHDNALAEIESLRLRIYELQTELTTSTEMQESSRKEIDALLKEKLALEEKEKETDTTINTLNDELVAAKLAHENGLTKLKEFEAEKKRMEGIIEQLTDDRNRVEAEIYRLNQLQSESEDKIVALEVKVTDLHAEKDALSKIIELNANEQSDLNTKIKQLTQASADAEQRFVSELKTAENRIKELNDTIEKHSVDQEQLQSNLAIATDRNVADASQIADLTSEVSKLTASEKTLRLENAQLNEAKSVAQTLVQEITVKLDAANKCIADCEAKIEQFTVQKAELEAQAVELNERLSAIGLTLSESQDKCLKLHSEMNEIRLDNEKKTEELHTQYAEEKVRFEREIDELIKKRDSIEADLQLERNKLVTEKASFELKIQELTEEKTHKESEANMLSEKVDSLTAELAQMKLDHIEELNKVRSEAAEREATIQREKEQLEGERSQLKFEIEQITSKHEQLEKSHNDNFTQLEIEIAERIATIAGEKQDVEEALTAMKQEMDRINMVIEKSKAENATFLKEKNALVTKVIELNRTIDDQQQQLAESKAYAEKVVGEKQLLQERFDQVETSHKEKLANLQKELTDSVTKIEQLEQEKETIKSELSNLQEENKLLVVATTNVEQLNALKSQIAHMQKKLHDSHDKWAKEREAMSQDVKILKAKLMKERELAEAKATEHDQQLTEVRHEFEEKLEKMKDKMKTLYSAEMSKVKAKHEVELMEHATEMQRHVEKIEQYEDRFKKLSNQLHVKNDQHLTLLKENEIMKSKMRTLESQTTFSNMKPNVPSSFVDRLRAGGSFKNEDEPDELFNEKYLEELKNCGSILMAGRESISADEIQRRNSMVPAHLRSSYMMQYQNQNLNDDSLFKIDDDQKTHTLDDSMLSTQSDTRRGTLYKRPGPPTPSKNAGRLSIGGTNAELPRGDILRESNKALVPTTAKSASKKSTPGKTLLSMFTTAKVKDEQMENYDPNVLSQLILPAKFEFSTSTPQRRLAKVSIPGKFDALSSFCNWENSLSFLRTTETAVYDSHQAISRPSIELTRIEEAMLQPMFNNPVAVKRTGKKMMNNRRRRTSSVEGVYKRSAKNAQQTNRREKRIDAFSRCRKLIDEEQKSVQIKSNDATFVIDDESESETEILDQSYIERCELDAFQKEIDRMEISSLINLGDDFPINENDENTNFEQLCNTKMSEHPYEEANSKVSTMELQENSSSNASDSVETSSSKFATEENNNNSPFPSCSPNTAKMNGHCTHPMYLHPHKIPQIVRHKSLARINLNSEDNISRCWEFISAYNKMHPFMTIYLIGISAALVGVLMHLFK